MYVITPYQATKEEMQVFKYVERICEQNNIKFLDINSYSEQIDFNFQTDMYDWGHCNIWGSTKASKFIANFIQNNYEVSDRRNSNIYSDWNTVVSFYYNSLEQTQNFEGEVK